MSDWWSKVVGKTTPKRSNSHPPGAYVPSYHDKFWVKNRGSGFVKYIFWSDKLIEVEYVDKSVTTYSWEEIEDKHSDRYGGIWVPDY